MLNAHWPNETRFFMNYLKNCNGCIKLGHKKLVSVVMWFL